MDIKWQESKESRSKNKKRVVIAEHDQLKVGEEEAHTGRGTHIEMQSDCSLPQCGNEEIVY